MPKIDIKTLKNKISKDELPCVLFLYGQEKYLLKLYLNKIIKQAQKNSFTQFNYNEFNDDSTIDEIADAALTLPFMTEKKLVIVSDYNIDTKNATDIKKLNELISDLSDSTCLVFALPTLLPDFKKNAKWKAFLKGTTEFGDTLDFEKLAGSDIFKFVDKIVSENDSSISKYNASKLVEYVGTDMTNLKNECEKLAAYARGSEINLEIIEDLVIKNAETTVFILIKSIIANNYKKAYELLDLLFTLGEEPVNILARIADNYVDLYRVRAALQSGKSALAPAEYAPYKNTQFRLTNAERDIRNISTQKLRQSLDLLVATDLALKSSKTKGKIVLEELIAKLLIINRGEI